MNSPTFSMALAGVPLYFALSGIVTAVGFSAILDVVPNRSRGLAMSMSFFLNVALGAGLGPTAVAVAGAHVFAAKAGAGAAAGFDRDGGLSPCPSRSLRGSVEFPASEAAADLSRYRISRRRKGIISPLASAPKAACDSAEGTSVR